MSVAHSFLLLNTIYSIYLYVYLCHRLFIHSSVDGHLGYFQFGAVMKKTVINIDVQVSVCTCVFISYM